MKFGRVTYLNIAGLVCCLVVFVTDLVIGQRSTRWTEGSLRLVGGKSENEGTVLIYHWSRWGAICDDHWDIRDANVVCNELGYPGAKEAPRRSRFGKGRRRIWLSGLHCRGNERHLTMCGSRGWGNQLRRCRSYWSSAGVICNPPTTTTSRKTTTTTTTTTSTTKKPTTTSSTTTTTTTPKPTTTRKTPTTGKPTTPQTTRKPTTSKTTKATTPKPVKKTTTSTAKPKTTTEQVTRKPTTKPTTRQPTTTAPRIYNQWVYNSEMWRYYYYFQNGTFITSRPDPRYYQNRNTTSSSTTTTSTTTTTTTRPRRIHSHNNNLIGGENTNAGNDIMENVISNVIEPSQSNYRHRHRHHGHNSRKEGYVQDQPSDPGALSSADANEIWSQASYDSNSFSYTEFRLSGGREYKGYKEGRLEVRQSGSEKWGVVCGDNWDIRAGIVACRHFGAGYARNALSEDYYGGTDQDKLISTIRCTGSEQRLEDCHIETAALTPGKESCSKPQSVAGVVCEEKLPDLEPDVKAIEQSAFLQDSYLYYLQCAYEENCLSSSATDLYGTRSWAYASRRLLRFSTIAKNIGTADFRPDIDRSQWEWHACHQHYHSMESFSHYDIIDEHGNRVAEGHKASFCLEDTRCNRGVYPKYDCEGFGHQGISVGCQDSYLADIDCQWIDVTDVKPGVYTMKVELNPNMKVPEISYDNNAAKCKLYLTTTQARVYECVLDSLL